MNHSLVALVSCTLVLGASLTAETTQEAATPTAAPPSEGNVPSVPPGVPLQLEGNAPSLPQSAPAGAQEEQKGHPFAHIVDRNVFALKPIPPPAGPEEAPPPPPPPLAKVILTGILNVLGPPRALLEVTETEPGKQPAQGTPKKPILREGERDGSIEVVSIDVEKSMVRIKNGGIETNLTFVELKQSGGGAPTPAAAPPALNASIPAPPGATAAYQPSSTGRGVVMGGATQLAANSYNNNSANPAALGSAQFQRQLRVPQTQPQQQPAQEIDAATQFIELKAREAYARQNNQRFPPLPPLPGIDDQPTPTPTPDTPPPQTRPPGLPGFPPLPPVPPR